MKIRKSNKGFTLIEILIVMSIIGFLFFLLIPQVNSFFLKSNEVGIRTDFRSFQQSSELFFQDTSGKNLHVGAFNGYMENKHQLIDSGSIIKTKSKDPWGNAYEVEMDINKMTFSSYGEKENPTNKKYKLVIYYEKGKIDTCTLGFATNNLTLSTINLPIGFVCGDHLSSTVVTSPTDSTLSSPSSFRVSDLNASSVVLSWNAVTHATQYILKRNGVIVYIGSNTSFSDLTISSNHTYTYSVAARNASDISSFATLDILTSVPSPPADFTIADSTDMSIDLVWGSVSGAVNYILKRDETVIYSGNTLSFSDSGLSADTSYSYSLTAKNYFGESDTVTLHAKTKLPLPPAPSNFRTTNVTSSSISLAWDSSTYATNYIVKQGSTVVYSGNDTSYIHSNLAGDTTYNYTVTAVNSTGVSDSSSLNVTTTLPVPTTPSNFRTTSVTSNSISLAWDSSPHATSYTVKRGTTILYTGSDTSYIHSGLSGNTSYTYTVSAKNSMGESNTSILTVTTETPVPLSPSNFRATTITSNSILLAWNTSFYATSYTLKRDGVILYTGGNTTFTHTGLSANTNYSYTITANNSKGDSSPASLYVTTDVYKGTGTSADPFLIYNCNDLQKVKDNLSADYQLASDIDCSLSSTWNSGKGFIPIGKNSTVFRGNFDGKHYKILNLYINRPTEDYVGLFGYVGNSNSKTIQNIGLENVNIKGKNHVGSLVGMSQDSFNGYKIHQVYATGIISGVDRVGGLIGSNYKTEIHNSFSHVVVSGEHYFGGLVGENSSSKIFNSYSTGVVSTTYLYPYDYGGLTGSNWSSTITNTYWNTDTSTMLLSSSGSGKTSAELKQQLTFTTWDFSTIWVINPSINNGYPYHKNNIVSDEHVYLGAKLLSDKIIIDFGYYGSNTTHYYKLYRNGTEIYSGTNKLFTDNGLTFNTSYTYKVEMYNASNVLIDSDQKSFKTKIMDNGLGIASYPYIIYTLNELNRVNTCLTCYYELGANIDASATSTWNSGKGFIPIGKSATAFSGNFDGKHYKISNLYINRPSEDYVGLFGYVGGSNNKTLQNIGLENVNIKGKNHVGSLMGAASNSSSNHKLSQIYATGTVTGIDTVGGLVGYNYRSEIANSYSHVDVTGEDDIGGLVGYSQYSSILNSYSTGVIRSVSLYPYGYGGLTGSSYSDTTSNSYWDTDTSTMLLSSSGIGKTSSEMKQTLTYSGWDFTNIWAMDLSVNNGYPYHKNNIVSDEHVYLGAKLLSDKIIIDFGYYGTNTTHSYKLYRDGVQIYSGSNKTFTDNSLSFNTSYTYKVEMYNASNVLIDSNQKTFKTKIMDNGLGIASYPYIIYTMNELNKVNTCLNCYYELGANIDASVTSTWNAGAGFKPIGKNTSTFIGNFDGKNYKISNLYINRPSEDYVGLFGYVGGSNNKTLQNIGLEHVNIKGRNYVGSLLGAASNSTSNHKLSQIYATGTVMGVDRVGGLVGYNYRSEIANSYSHVVVTGEEYIGGFVGYSQYSSIVNSYSTGVVNPISSYPYAYGGLTGSAYSDTTSNSYWDTDTSSLVTSGGGTGKTTTELKQQLTFTNWDFTTIWAINPLINDGYPYLKGNVPTP